jgi:hypothetical protein
LHGLTNSNIIQELTTNSPFSINNRHPYFVSMRATAENPVSHKYIITEEISLNYKTGEPFSQAAKTEEAIPHET